MNPAQNSATDCPPLVPAGSGFIKFGCLSSSACSNAVATSVESLLMEFPRQ